MGEDGLRTIVNDLQESRLPNASTTPQPSQYCDVSAQTLTVTLERTQAGLQFTRATYKGFLATLVSSSIRERGMFEFISPLDWSIWVLLLASAFIVPLLVIFLESAYSERCARLLGCFSQARHAFVMR